MIGYSRQLARVVSLHVQLCEKKHHDDQLQRLSVKRVCRLLRSDWCTVWSDNGRSQADDDVAHQHNVEHVAEYRQRIVHLRR